jgi:starch-binding outer membrane protein, SusD/RagB family
VNVVRALISRFGLREGTWRKYHGLTDATKYLTASFNASDKLVTAFPTLHPEFHELFTSDALAGKTPEVLLFKNYVKDQVTHVLSTWARSSSGRHDLTKKGADMFLLTDGQTRFTSPLFVSDTTAYVEFRNRDKRLLQTITPPYKITLTSSTVWAHTANAADREYFPVMAALSKDTSKRLPARNWNGLLLSQEPHFFDFNYGQPFNGTYTGYRFYKFETHINTGISSRDVNDAPIFRMGEIMVNYAEAAYELGTFDQAKCDKSINKLRTRGGVALLNIGAIPNDPTRDPSVDPVLWEIRRERAVELIGEGFRFDDLRRWKKMDYATQQKLGRWIKRSDYGNVVPTLNNTTQGYVAYEGVPPAFPSHYYLYPIPSDQIVLNPKIKQNPIW